MGKGPRVDCSKEIPKTQQSSKDEADVNVIVERAKRGAVVPLDERPPRYMDLTQVPTDLREALNQFNFAKSLFMSLDPKVRFRFQNDPVQMLDFLADSKNRKEAEELGLIEPKAEVAVKPEEVVTKTPA